MNWSKVSTNAPSLYDFYKDSMEIGTCMRCGDYAVLEESEYDGAHACKYGCGKSHYMENKDV